MKKLILLALICLLLTGCVRTSLIVINGKKGVLGVDGSVIKKTSISDKAKDVKSFTTITIEGDNIKVIEDRELIGDIEGDNVKVEENSELTGSVDVKK